jgi:hypothetical protein
MSSGNLRRADCTECPRTPAAPSKTKLRIGGCVLKWSHSAEAAAKAGSELREGRSTPCPPESNSPWAACSAAGSPEASGRVRRSAGRGKTDTRCQRTTGGARGPRRTGLGVSQERCEHSRNIWVRSQSESQKSRCHCLADERAVKRGDIGRISAERRQASSL